MRIPFQNIGRVGVVKDLPDWQLPPDAWTEAENIRFKENAAWRAFGYQKFVEPPSVAPTFAMQALIKGEYWWLYASEAKVYATRVGVHHNLTRQLTGTDQDYTGTGLRWNGTVLSSVPILNNGMNIPQVWSPVSISQRLQNMPNWPSTTRAQVVRAFDNFLVSLRIRKGVDISDGVGGTLYPTLLQWSHPADPGFTPPSFDVTDPTVDAGEYDLQGEKGDELVDCLPLGNNNIIYKTQSVHAMTYIGGIAIFRFFKLPFNFGMLTQRCAADLGTRHFVVTESDIVIHNGQTFESILEARVKRYLFSHLDPTYYRWSFVLNYRDAKEVWFCFPEIGSGSPGATKALIWNALDGSIGFRDLPGVYEGDNGGLDPGAADAWENDLQSWAEDNTTWSIALPSAVDRAVVLPKPQNEDLLLMDRSYQNDGANFSARLERTALRFPADGEAGMALNGPSTVKQIQSVYPAFEGTLGAQIQVTVGAANRPREEPTWGTPRTFTLGLTERVDLVDSCPASKYPALRFSSSGGDAWKLTGFAVDVQVVGSF